MFQFSTLSCQNKHHTQYSLLLLLIKTLRDIEIFIQKEYWFCLMVKHIWKHPPVWRQEAGEK